MSSEIFAARINVLGALLLMLISLKAIRAQSSTFTYQGRLTDGGTAANGNYDFQFALFDSLSGGTQIGSTQTLNTIAVSNGVFTVSLDFGAGSFTGGNRFLEISARPNGVGSFTLLAPRQQMTATPYAIRSVTSATSDTATTAVNATSATNAAQLGGIAASQYVQTNDSHLFDSRPPTAGSANYIQNGTTAQSNTNFNISGNGTANVLTAAIQFNLGGSRILSAAASNNLIAGVNAGASNTTGSNSSFFGTGAGQSNTTGNQNSFFGIDSGFGNTTGANNSFFGSNAGFSNNSSGNSFFGSNAGSGNSSGAGNSFFGTVAGSGNTTGQNNSFFGFGAGQTNLTGSNISVLGANANVTATNLDHATAIGADAIVGSSNTVVLGRTADLVKVPGAINVTGSATFGASLSADSLNAATQYNIGGSRVLSSNADSTFIGVATGANPSNFLGFNTFVGSSAGSSNTQGFNNSLFGFQAGFQNTFGGDNSFFGARAGGANTGGTENSFFGSAAGLSTSNGCCNSFFGAQAGKANTTGAGNIAIGRGADFGSGDLHNATVIGIDAIVSASNSIVLGRSTDKVGIGVSAPTFKLHVLDSANTGLRVETSTTGGTVASFGGNGDFQIDAVNVFGGRFIVQQGGNVGIGAAAPKARLDVTGGNILVGSPGQGIILKSPNSITCRLLAIDNAGNMTLAAIACP